jgi:hypothetical protein
MRSSQSDAIGRALFARIAQASTTEAIIEQIIDLLAETARRLWPVWFTDVSFDGCRNDTLGRLAVSVIAQNAVGEIAGISTFWLEAAARLALADRSPRVTGAVAETEVRQIDPFASNGHLRTPSGWTIPRMEALEGVLGCFQHPRPLSSLLVFDCSSLTRWRKRRGREAGAQLLCRSSQTKASSMQSHR